MVGFIAGITLQPDNKNVINIRVVVIFRIKRLPGGAIDTSGRFVARKMPPFYFAL